MVLVYYYDLLSQPCRAIYILLKISDIQFQSHIVNLSKLEHYSEDFKKVSKSQRVPVISDDGFNIIESVAILRYLAKTQELRPGLYPSDTRQQTRIDEYLEWQHHNTRLLCTLYFQRKWLYPKVLGRITPPEKLATYERNMNQCLDAIEQTWIGDKPFLMGDKLTVADIWAACEIEQIKLTGYNVRTGRAILSKWLDRVREELNPYYDEAHSVVNELLVQPQLFQAKI